MLGRLRDDGLLITYKLDGEEYVSSFALRDLQVRLAVAPAQGA